MKHYASILACLTFFCVFTSSNEAEAAGLFSCGAFQPLIGIVSGAAFGGATTLVAPLIADLTDQATPGSDNYDLALGFAVTSAFTGVGAVAGTVFVSVFDGCGSSMGSNDFFYAAGIPAGSALVFGLLAQPLVRALSPNKKNQVQVTLIPTLSKEQNVNGAMGGLSWSF